jgi:hypothetical protein
MANAAQSITDGYDSWYAEKIWRLLPAIYRTLDVSSVPGGAGPLREMVNRIGSQVAVVRRNIDRVWEDQSIETCDDWVIPYIGDLLATRLIPFLDARARRLDVANTIFYRRRAGTLGLLERLASDVAGRDAHAVEFFRRLGRTRHQFDPQIGVGGAPVGRPLDPTDLASLSVPMIEGLVGRFSMTPAGGFADLRNVYGADNAGTAFDEFAHTADLRRGQQSTGWYNISHLGVFVWWLQSFPIVGATPCSAPPSCPGRFTFDPSGRQMQLFALASRTAATSFGENWVTPNEWELPVPIRPVLYATVPDELYPNSLSVDLSSGGVTTVIDRSELVVYPDLGLFHFSGAQPPTPIVSSYHFGFLSAIGAGGFDADTLLPELSFTPPVDALIVAGGTGNPPPTLPDAVTLATALPPTPITASRTVDIVDSLTYSGPSSTTQVQGVPLVVRADAPQRPLLRWSPAGSTWTIQGSGSGSILLLQGLWLQGADLVLKGDFDEVHLRLMTLDPGTSSASNATPPNQQPNLKTVPPPFFGLAIDGLPLRPTTLYVEGTIAKLVIERSITGPIRTRNGGAVEQLTASDSILQAVATHAAGMGPILDPASLALYLKTAPASDPLAQAVIHAVPNLAAELAAYSGGAPSTQLVQDLTSAVAAQSMANRLALEARLPLAFADVALGLSSGNVSLSRCTVLGACATHRMDVSESILDDVAVVEDAQHGCVRFSAYAQGSVLHQPYRSVAVPRVGPIFVTRNFGEPEYVRLRRDADRAILGPAAPDATILGGAESGSEMGAFSLEDVSLKKQGLAIKFVEFMPLGTSPVWIDAD